jgi:hypothetical protein
MRREARPLLVLALMLLASCSVLLAPSRAAEINGHLTLHGNLNGCVATGTATAYVCAPVPSIGSYRAGTLYSFIAPATNTGVLTINYNGIGARTIKKVIAGVVTDLRAGDITSGDPVVTIFDGTFLRMVSPPGTAIQLIASGTLALATASIASGACATAQTVAATGTLTTDTILASFNGDVTGVTGYTAATTGSLRVDVFPTANNVSARVCNNTAAAITPGAVTINWRVVR